MFFFDPLNKSYFKENNLLPCHASLFCQVVWITGADGGLGERLAINLTVNGAKVCESIGTTTVDDNVGIAVVFFYRQGKRGILVAVS